MKIVLTGDVELAAILKRANSIKYSKICMKSLTQIFNKGKTMTPVSTEITRPGGPHGELRQSMKVVVPSSDFGGEVGYVKDYAPHVEYGHRTKGGGFVPGQKFLFKMAEEQKPIFHEDLVSAVGKVMK